MLTDDARIVAIETSGRAGSVAVGTPAGLLAVQRLAEDVRHAGELLPTVQRLISSQGWAGDAITDVFISIGPGSFTGLRIAVTVARTLAWAVGSRIVAVPTMHALARNALAASDEDAPSHVAMIVDAKRSQVYTACHRIESITAGGADTPVNDGKQAAEAAREAQEVEGGSAVGARDAGAAARGASGAARERHCVELVPACLAEPREFLLRCPQPVAVLGEGVPRHREAIAAAGAAILPEELWAGRAENVFAVGLEMARAGQYTPPRELVPLYIRRPEMEERWEARHKTGTCPIERGT